VQALTDPAFDLYGVQCTGGLTAPLIVVSGPIIKDLNINFSYSTAGPGWRANSTIGRAMRLMLINLGQAWPGVNDMKDVGNPAKFGIVIADAIRMVHAARTGRFQSGSQHGQRVCFAKLPAGHKAFCESLH
jgi:hypothetical protein